MNSSFKLQFLLGFLILFGGLPVEAEESSNPPLSADEVMERVVAMNEQRASALAGYSSVRRYHLDCRCLIPKKADMVVRVSYEQPNKKAFTIISESGSETVRRRVFKRLLDAERDSMQRGNQKHSAITPENYTFTLLIHETTEEGEFFVLQAQPRNKNKFLFRGRIWVNAKDFAVTRVEGEPAVNPSWWTQKTDFSRTYSKVGDFWLPKTNESTTKVRIFGTAVLTIDYGEYEINKARSLQADSLDKQSAHQSSDEPQ